MDGKFLKIESGQSLFEVLLALAVFAMAIAAIAHLFLGAHYSTAYSVEKSQAVLLAKEGIEAVRSIRDADFENIAAKTNIGIELVANKWQFTGDELPDVTEKFTRAINIIVGPLYAEAWQVESIVTWTSVTGNTAEVSFIEYLAPWRLAPKYTLTLTVEGAGTAQDLTDGSPYEEGTIVDIKAVPGGGWVFDNWTTGDGGAFADPNAAETTYTMPGNAAIVTANFIPE
jgi:hypothetical protein